MAMHAEPVIASPRRLLLVAPRLSGRLAELVAALGRRGIEVSAVTDARAAERQLAGAPFDLVICDLALRDGSGLELLRGLRARDAQVPVVLLCGAERPLPEAAELGAFCLQEPVTLDSLVRTALRRIHGHVSLHRSIRAPELSEATDAVAATVAKNQFGRVLGAAVKGRRVVITKHDTPMAVLISFDTYRELTGAETPDLDALGREFDGLLARMQTRAAHAATDALFRASPSELAEAAVSEARGEAPPAERG